MMRALNFILWVVIFVGGMAGIAGLVILAAILMGAM